MQHQTAVLFEEIKLQSATEEVLCTTQQWIHHIFIAYARLCQHVFSRRYSYLQTCHQV